MGLTFMENHRVEVSIARMEERLENILTKVNESATKIQSLEEFKWKLLGAAAVIGSISGLLGKFVAHLIS